MPRPSEATRGCRRRPHTRSACAHNARPGRTPLTTATASRPVRGRPGGDSAGRVRHHFRPEDCRENARAICAWRLRAIRTADTHSHSAGGIRGLVKRPAAASRVHGHDSSPASGQVQVPVLARHGWERRPPRSFGICKARNFSVRASVWPGQVLARAPERLICAERTSITYENDRHSSSGPWSSWAEPPCHVPCLVSLVRSAPECSWRPGPWSQLPSSLAAGLVTKRLGHAARHRRLAAFLAPRRLDL